MRVATLGMSEAEREALAKFERDVVEPSMTRLVLIDFWAERSALAKQMAPVLDKIAADYAAKGVVLVRIDVDQDKMIAAQFQLKSIPTVYAFFGGQPVADLTAYRTEAQLTKILDQLLGQLPVKGEAQALEAEIEPLIAMAEQILSDGDAPRAVSIFRQVLDMAPANADVIGGLARALIAAGEIDEARTILDATPAATACDAAVARARAALDIASAAPALASDELEARVSADPDDHQARFDLAGARMAAGNRDGAADALLEIIARDVAWNEGAARTRLLQLLEAAGYEDPWGKTQRRRLSSLLFT